MGIKLIPEIEKIQMKKIVSVLLIILTISSFAQEKETSNKSGQHPYGTLLKAKNGKLYGLTHEGGEFDFGVLFEFDPKNNKYEKLVDFDGENKGKNPRGSLVQAKNGNLYGLTYNGGLYDKGVLFEYSLTNYRFTKKIDFDGDKHGLFPIGTLIESINGSLYGITEGIGVLSDSVIYYEGSTIFKFDILKHTLTSVYDFNQPIMGEAPQTSLMQASNGKLYGVTYKGGNYDLGVLFEFDVANNKFNKKVDFKKNQVGYYPSNALIELNHKLFGTTTQGGTQSKGTLFVYNIQTGSIQKKCTLTKKRGYILHGRLLNSNESKLFGMTLYGGRYKLSRIFSYDLSKSRFDIEYEFYPTQTGNSAHGSLIEVDGDSLFGMTYYGGKHGTGTIFKFDKKSKNVEAAFNFR